MTSEAKRTLALIRACIAAERYTTTTHFTVRMRQRALFWPDIQAVVNDPDDIESDGTDKYGRPKWKISGKAADLGEIGIICAVEFVKNETGKEDESGTVFITLYWEN